MVATDVVKLFHVPPVGVAFRVTVVPGHVESVPVIAGWAFTVTVRLTEHPEPREYVINVFPASRPLILAGDGDELLTEATEVLFELQVPPATDSVKVVDDPSQTTWVPVNAAGLEDTVNVWVLAHDPPVPTRV